MEITLVFTFFLILFARVLACVHFAVKMLCYVKRVGLEFRPDLLSLLGRREKVEFCETVVKYDRRFKVSYIIFSPRQNVNQFHSGNCISVKTFVTQIVYRMPSETFLLPATACCWLEGKR